MASKSKKGKAKTARKDHGNVYYVYALTDPRDGKIFYVGKGKGDRCKQHAREARSGYGWNVAKQMRILDIIASGYAVQIDVVRDRLTEEQALHHERILIRANKESLTNIAVPGRSPAEVSYLKAKWMYENRTSMQWWVGWYKRRHGCLPTSAEYEFRLKAYSLYETNYLQQSAHWEKVRRP